MIPTHLSIDLDYWANYPVKGAYPISPGTFFKRVFALEVPIRVYMYHQEVVPQINRSKCTRLINMDYHSDWSRGSPRNHQSLGDTIPHEGNWADWIKWRKQGEFIWLPPHPDCVLLGFGRCDQNRREPWPPEKVMKTSNEWKQVKFVLCPWKSINWKGITDISVVVSPDYLHPEPLIKDGIFDQLRIDVPEAKSIIENGWDSVSCMPDDGPEGFFKIVY